MVSIKARARFLRIEGMVRGDDSMWVLLFE